MLLPEDLNNSNSSLNSILSNHEANRFVVESVESKDEYEDFSASRLSLPQISAMCKSNCTLYDELAECDDNISVGNASIFSRFGSNLLASPGNMLSLLADSGSVFGSTILLANQSYLDIYQEVDKASSRPQLDDVSEEEGDIFDNPEYIDTLEGRLPLAKAARMISKDSTRHKSLFDESHIRATRKDCYKRVFTIGICFQLLFSSSYSIRSAFNSLGEDKQLLLVCFGSLFSLMWFGGVCANPIIYRIRPKWAMVLATTGFVVYPLSMYHITYYTTLPASIFMGFCIGLIWSIEGVYLINTASTYSIVSGEPLIDVISKFSAIIFFFFMSSNISGNLIGSLSLGDLYTLPGEIDQQTQNISFDVSAKINATIGDVYNLNHNLTVSHDYVFNFSSGKACGLDYYSHNDDNATIQTVIYAGKQYIFYGINTILPMIASLIIIVFLRKLKVARRPGSGNLLRELKRFGQILVDPRGLLLLPLMLLCGVANSVIMADYTAGFVACAYGVDMIGYVIMTAYCFSASGAFLSAKLVKLIGRIPVFVISLLITLFSSIFMLMWKPTGGNIEPLVFICPCLWAFADGITYTQTSCILSMIFRKKIVYAVTMQIFGLAMGALFGTLALAFGLFTLTIKVYLMISFTIAAAIGYIMLEILLKKEVLK